jgi:hypothetical protein
MKKVATVLLGIAVPAVFAATAVMVSRYTPAEPSDAGPASAAATDPLPVTAPPGPLYDFPDYSSASLGEAVAGLEAAGAYVTAIDARLWERQILPDWQVCTQSQVFMGDGTPTDRVTVAAVPVGDPCP